VNVKQVEINCSQPYACQNEMINPNIYCDGELACKATMHWPDNVQQINSNISCVTNTNDTIVCAMEMYVQEGYTSDHIHLKCNEDNHLSCAGSFYHCGSHYQRFCSMIYIDGKWTCVGSCPSETIITNTTTRTKNNSNTTQSTAKVSVSYNENDIVFSASITNTNISKSTATETSTSTSANTNANDTSSKTNHHWALIVGAAAAFVCLILLCCCCIAYCRRKRAAQRISGGPNYGTLRTDDGDDVET